jgi:peroxiredoxin
MDRPLLAWSVISLLLLAGSSVADDTPATTPESNEKSTAPATEAAPDAAKPAEPQPAAEAKSEGEPKPDAKEKPAEESTNTGPLPGHSYHGEVFDEGPRQKAYLMPGMPKINFPATTKSPEAQAFINQGVGQLHGFWYYEAERSFRQAALLDKDCAIAYWGMALANVDNASRGKKFMEECVKHKSGASERELMYIDAADAFFKAPNNKKKERNEAYTKALEKILYKYPEDIEAKALLALQLWKNRDAGIPITSHLAIDALIGEVLAVDPLHPAHHYRIHLWDLERAEKALASSALCGQGSSGIAHMWHMPGHIYSRVKRYEDACWQQEASARVDHAHMMRDRVLPDQIHNFAHNNEWLIRNMIFVGRMRDAIDLAKNMCELPRHPKFNTPSKGSANFGRLRLVDSLTRFEAWDELIALADSPYLAAGSEEADQVKHLRMLGAAHYRRGNVAAGDLARGDAILADLRQRWADLQVSQNKAASDAEAAARKENKSDADIVKARDRAKNPLRNRVTALQKAVDELIGHQAVAYGDYARGYALLKEAGGSEADYLARVQFLAGEQDKAIEAARSHASSRKNEVIPQATLVELLWKAGKQDEAKKALEALREMSGSVDLSAPFAARIAPIAAECGFSTAWKIEAVAKSDTGNRPALDSLGPLRWQPSPAIAWQLSDEADRVHSLADYKGRPVVVVFYLGHGCLHCAEQVQKFGAAAKEFEAAGLSLIAISSDDANGLKQSIENYKDGPIPFPLVADSTLDTFKAYRCFDDFEQLPLHGTFLIDGQGLVRWQDIGPEPFMDPKFVIGEAQRLLKVTQPSQPAPLATTDPMAAE